MILLLSSVSVFHPNQYVIVRPQQLGAIYQNINSIRPQNQHYSCLQFDHLFYLFYPTSHHYQHLSYRYATIRIVLFLISLTSSHLYHSLSIQLYHHQFHLFFYQIHQMPLQDRTYSPLLCFIRS